MGLDSVEIVMGWEDSFGISITPAEAEALRTPGQAVDLIAGMLAICDEPKRGCLTLRAFHRLRSSMMIEAGVPREKFRLDARLGDLVNALSLQTWKKIRSSSGISSLPASVWFSPKTVSELVRWTVVHATNQIKVPGENWTRSEICSVVRAVVTDVTGITDFKDDDDFVRDIGVS